MEIHQGLNLYSESHTAGTRWLADGAASAKGPEGKREPHGIRKLARCALRPASSWLQEVLNTVLDRIARLAPPTIDADVQQPGKVA